VTVNKRTTVALLVALAIPPVALPGITGGQEIGGLRRGAQTRYGVTLGVAWYQARDQVLASLRHQGPKISLGFFREGMSSSALHRVGLTFAFAPLTDRYSPDRSSLLFHPSIEVKYAKKTVHIGDDTDLYVGGTLGWNTRFSFYENWDQAHPYWLTSSHIGAVGTLVRGLANGNAVRFELSFPLLAAVSRPPERFDYKEVNPDFGWVLRHIHKDLRVTSLHEHTAVTATLAYERRGGGLLGQRFFWQTNFISTRLPSSRPFLALSHTLGISHPF
jgi:hypothetical protein